MLDNAQILTIVLAAVPSTFAVIVGILMNNSRFNDLNARISDLRSDIDSQFKRVDQRFDEARDLWRAELRRVEEVLDARLKHLEER